MWGENLNRIHEYECLDADPFRSNERTYDRTGSALPSGQNLGQVDRTVNCHLTERGDWDCANIPVI